MEFHEKLQDLRKQKGITQAKLAKEIYVSRTAVSKWESGRGYPNIDSLQELAKYFSVTVDELLSGEELKTIEAADQRIAKIRDLVYGILDVCMVFLLFVPIFGQTVDRKLQSVSLFALTGVATYLKIWYIVVIIGMIFAGIAILALLKWRNDIWDYLKSRVSLAITAAAALLFTLSRQPYAAALLMIVLTIKAALLPKKQ